MRLVLFFFILASCTNVKDKGVHRKDLVIWDLERTYKNKLTHKDIQLFYKTCFPAKDRKYDFWEPLRGQFREKFLVELIGLSDAESHSYYVQDSSLFVPNEVCLHISGNPVTEKVLRTDVKGRIEFTDKNHHVH